MIIRKISIVIFIISICFYVSVYALKGSDNDIPFKVFIYFDKMIFENNEQVLLHINIKNNTQTAKSFKIYDVDYSTFRPVVYNMKGQEVESLVTYRLMDKRVKDIIKDTKPRIIELTQNDTFSYAIDLKTIYKIDEGEEYRVKVMFYPDASDADEILGDNQINFKITAISDLKNSGISKIRKYISPERVLSPSEVVMLFLKAEKNSDWDNFFKYINIEKLINSYPDYVRAYREAVNYNDIEKKEEVILAFVDFLKEKRIDYIISYDIVNEFNNNDNYTVEALVKRYGHSRPFIYKYRYLLERYNNFWIIDDIEATVVKEENK